MKAMTDIKNIVVAKRQKIQRTMASDRTPPPSSSSAGAGGTTEVDEKLYSRQLYVMGHEAQRRMMSSRAVIVGMSGLGAEIAKNIILAGISSVTLVDPTLPTSYDLGGNFYLNEGDLNKCDDDDNDNNSVRGGRAALCRNRLAELNEYVKVDVATNVSSLHGDDIDTAASLLNVIRGASVVVITVPLSTSLLCTITDA